MVNLEDIGRQAIDFLKKRANAMSAGDAYKIIYCDLGGHNLTAAQYCQKLDDDSNFAFGELEVFLNAQPLGNPPRGLSVREQLQVAGEVVRYVASKGASPSALKNFIESRPLIAGSFSAGDLEKVAQTLRFEHGLNVDVPTQDFLDDVCRRYGLSQYKKS